MTGQRSRLILSSKARQQFRELRRSIASVSGSEVTARNYMSALTDYIEQLPDFPLRGQAFSLHHPGMRIIGFRKTLLIAFLVTDDSVVILSVLSTRQSRLTLEEALTQALELFQHQRKRTRSQEPRKAQAAIPKDTPSPPPYGSVG